MGDWELWQFMLVGVSLGALIGMLGPDLLDWWRWRR